MKKILMQFVVSAIALSFATGAFAQAAGPAAGVGGGLAKHHGEGKWEGRGKVMAEMLAKLDLSEAQRKSISQIQEDYRVHLKELMEKIKAGGGTKAENRERVQELNKAHMKELMEVLTPAQRKQLKQEMKRWRDEHKENKPKATP